MADPKHSHWQNDPAILAAAKNSPALKQGATGSGVQRLREALSVMGAPGIAEPLDQFGPLTKGLVATFQAIYSLSTDGTAGTQTILKLEALLSTVALRKPWKPPTVYGSREEFLQAVASECGPVIREAVVWNKKLPVSAMMACAALESGWGGGRIFKDTGNLFSMQKWPWVPFPKGETLWRPTVIQESPKKTANAPFNVAKNLADSARQWCEWIAYYGEAEGPPGNINKAAIPASNPWAIGRRNNLLSMVGHPVEFAKNLYLVSFGESHAKGQRYAQVLLENNLTRFD